MVARSVIGLIVTDRPDRGELVRNRSQPLHVLGELNAGQLGRDRIELAPNLGWSGWLGIEGLEVSRSSVHPNQDATLGHRRRSRSRFGSPRPPQQSLGKAHPHKPAQAQRKGIAASDSVAVAVVSHGIASKGFSGRLFSFVLQVCEQINDSINRVGSACSVFSQDCPTHETNQQTHHE